MEEVRSAIRSRESREKLAVGHLNEKEIGFKKGLRLTLRDFEILSFLNDQKFATLPTLYFRFFDKRSNADDAIPNNFWVTRQRLSILRRVGLINTVRVFTDAKALYILTHHGYEVLKGRIELDFYAEPVLNIDFRYYEHDKRVSLCRVALERQGKCLKWHPDRFLKQKNGFPYGDHKFSKLPSNVIPDGVFISSKQERVAVELEHTPKKRDRYVDKMRHYGRLFSFDTLDRAVFIASNDRIGKDLQEIFSDTNRFKVFSFETLVGGVLGREALVL